MAEARISSSVAGGLKLCKVLMFLHIVFTWLLLRCADRLLRCRFYLPKNPGSIRYQFTRPASKPMPSTPKVMNLSPVVFGFPTLLGNSSRNTPPTTQTGPNVESFMEYRPSDCN